MYKILVAESEPETALAIQKVINKHIPEAKVIRVVENGNDAVVETVNGEPDLILIGIRMIGLNGLDAIARIREFNPNVHIIIVSAYDYFEFAKKAMKLGVNDYLLKPLDERSLKESIKRELTKVGEERECERAYKNEEMQFSDALRIVEKHFIYSIVYNQDVEQEMEQYKAMLRIGEQGFILGVEIESSFLKTHWDVGKVSERIYRRIKDVINSNGLYAIGTRLSHRFVMFVSASGIKAGKDGQTEIVELSKEIVRALQQTFDLESRVSIGGIKPVESIQDSYIEMMKSHRYDNESTVVYYKEVRYKNALRETYMELTEKLIESIRYDLDNVRECFTEILEQFRPLSSEERLTRLLEVFMGISYEFRKELKNQDVYFPYITSMDNLMDMKVEEQEACAYGRLNVLIKMVRMGRDNRKTSAITNAMEYVEKHYNEDISLNQISTYVNLSPQHFSKIFKEETKFNYVEWVNNLRVSKAKEYMNETNLTIKEICYQVGYKDPNYFSRIFKRCVGSTPTEYMKERTLIEGVD